MITAYDVQFQTYCTKIGEYEVEVWDDGDVVIDGPNGTRIYVRAVEMASFIEVAAEFI